MAHVGKLPQLHRYITTHNEEGKAVFSDAISEESRMGELPDGMAFALSYTSQGFPVDINDDADIRNYQGFLESAPGLVISNGTVLRHVDLAPDTTTAMHRTQSLDYGICLEGELELILDSGEARTLKKGDVAIQRGTMHAWRNTSKTEWARIVFVLQPCKPVQVGAGKALEEEFETPMHGVRGST
ncbi:uncharacterized protein K452DRAFT_237049 [Aplosporella prunicola CBS 121167]|uniref:Cupin type-2 domain-containing protein n=1 Tax=Aplosporella prunicola CBS 121167 TaxID=1176127 RepID=A0A6A6AZM5_9PEZI|nr:uncharacterized protein K452DRAFT_237049 [Aplosporella prunicola CBS 121167]KAF2136718.1 hypothetical protein K452DRAFT_237049 [Aplosporella prunicola CBS 121167]